MSAKLVDITSSWSSVNYKKERIYSCSNVNFFNNMLQVIFSSFCVNLNENVRQYLGCDEPSSLLK